MKREKQRRKTRADMAREERTSMTNVRALSYTLTQRILIRFVYKLDLFFLLNISIKNDCAVFNSEFSLVSAHVSI